MPDLPEEAVEALTAEERRLLMARLARGKDLIARTWRDVAAALEEEDSGN
jgi:hypothetical protein